MPNENETVQARFVDPFGSDEPEAAILTDSQNQVYAYLIEAGYTDAAAMDAALQVQIEEAETSYDTGFHVTDDSSANWLTRKLSSFNKEQAVINAMIDEEMAEHTQALNDLADRRQQLLRPVLTRRDYFMARWGAELENWTRDAIVGAKNKYRDLVHARCGLRKKQDKIIVDDSVKAVAYLEANDVSDAVKITKSVLVSKIPKTLTDVDGAWHTEIGKDEFYMDLLP